MGVASILRAVLALNIAFYAVTAWLTGSLISSGTVTAARPFSWEEDWDILTILALLAVVNAMALIFTLRLPAIR